MSCMRSRFSDIASRASQRYRLHDEGKPEISDFTSVSHVGPVLQSLGGDLWLQKLKIITPHGHHASPDVRFNWSFEKRTNGDVYLARLYEACVVDHLVVIDSRCWPSLLYDSCDPYPLILSLTSFFQCGGSDAEKLNSRSYTKSPVIFVHVQYRRTWRGSFCQCFMALKIKNIVTVKLRGILISWMHHVALSV